MKKYPNEIKEVLQHLAKPAADGRLPDILPPDDVLVKMSAKEITTKQALYTGEKSAELLARLRYSYLNRCVLMFSRPNKESETGFIATNEDVGEVILADIKQLLSIGTII